MAIRSKLLVSACLVVFAVACGSSDADPVVGVNDVTKACAIRATWTRTTSEACVSCVAISTSPKCDCPAFQQDYAGKCADQHRARIDEASCAGVDDCIGKCNATDCTCIDACYAQKDQCHTLSAALDGCVAQECTSTCQ